ncbi:MAG: class IV adenylate cyclase [Thermoplasmata archaeon]|nr:MAG: class IV adenylate cyclase [Thermoplasmata archaeon]
MQLEVELKAYADDLSSVKAKLEGAGANFIKAHLEVDTYFSHPERDFGQTDEALRLRIIIPEEGNDVQKEFEGAELGKCELSYKGPKIDPASKTREEYTVHIGNIIAAERILTKLGFKRIMEIRKQRTIYELDDYTVCLDDVEHLGTFVEIEKIILNDQDFKGTRQDIQDIFKEILKLDRFERRSYLELILENDNQNKK